MIIKLMGSTLVIIAAAMIGFEHYNCMKNKMHFTEGAICGLRYLKKEMGFSMINISEGLILSAEYAGCAGRLFSMSGEELKKNGTLTFEAWSKSLTELYNQGTMCKRAMVILEQFGRQLGKSDIEGEISNLDGTIEKLEQCSEFQRNEFEKKGKLYKKAGLLGGIALVVILI